jgi:hypothetical protein
MNRVRRQPPIAQLAKEALELEGGEIGDLVALLEAR